MLTQQSPEANRIFRDREQTLALRRADSNREAFPYRPAAEILRDGAWRGERCFIIGGGPSLIGFDFERLRGKGKIIVINKGYTHVPFADVLFFMDHASFYMRLKRGVLGAEALKAWADFKGARLFLNLKGRKVEDAYSVRSSGREGLSLSLQRGLFHGNNSGYGALGLAACMRANPIYLLGYDMKSKGNTMHFHGGYGYRQPESVLRAYAKSISALAPALARAGFKVINLNPDSALKCFPFGKIDEVLQ